LVWALLAGGVFAEVVGARPAQGDSPLARWLDGILVPAGASVVQIIAYRPSGPVSRAHDGPASVFRLEPARRTFWATGVVIDEDGLVLACAEAAQPGDSLEIRLPGGMHSGARFLAQDLDLGLSLLRAEDVIGLLPVSLVPAGPIHEGEAAVLFGHRAGRDGPEFRFARIFDIRKGPEEPRFYRLVLGDCHGACGDAVFDEHGGFRGIIIGVRAEREQDVAPPRGTPASEPFECEWVRALSLTGIAEASTALIAASRSTVGFLGVMAAAGDSASGAAGESPSPRLPLQITLVLPGSPADAAGLRPGDQIVSLHGQPATSMEQIANVIAASRPGREIRIRVLRDGAPLALSARLGDRSALGWMDRQEGLDAARRKRLRAAIGWLQREIVELDAQRRRGP
jgi:S1-C subfamily serine protease